jgi:hypothetical protein
VQGLEKEPRKLQSFFKGGNVGADVYKGNVGGLPVVLIRPDSNLFKVSDMALRDCRSALLSRNRQQHIRRYMSECCVNSLPWQCDHMCGL